MKLNLGVVDMAYADPNAKGLNTTGQVAELLENEYHVMWVFSELNKEFLSQAIEDKFISLIEAMAQGAPAVNLESMLETGGPQGVVSGASLNDKIEERFRDYLDSGDWEKTFGVQLEAGRKGVSHRKKKPYAKGPERPAFIDTGLYQSAFRAWIE